MTQAFTSTPPRSRPLDAVSILVVEDDRDLLELEAATLRGAGARVEAVTNASAALDLLERERFDVVVSDLALPELDGFTLMRRLRAREAGSRPRVPALAVTGLAGDEDVAEAARAGYDAHVKKPIDLGDLVLAIRFLARKRNKRKNEHGSRASTSPPSTSGERSRR